MDTEAGTRAYGSDGDAAGTGTHRILVAICAVNGACAIALGALMMLAPSGQGWDASIVLALVAGGANAGTAALAAMGRSRRASAAIGLAAGALVVAWCAVELVFRANVMASGYLVIGLLQTAFAVQMRR